MLNKCESQGTYTSCPLSILLSLYIWLLRNFLIRRLTKTVHSDGKTLLESLLVLRLGAFICIAGYLETWCSAYLSYFIWDTLDAVINFVDTGFILHGKC